MKKLILLSIFFFYCHFGFTQLFEIAEDKGYSYELADVVNFGDSMWVTAGNYYYGNVGQNGTYIKAVNNQGELIWEYTEDINSWGNLIYKLVKTNDGNLAAIGVTDPICDVIQASPLAILIFDSEGNLVEEQFLSVDLNPWPISNKACATSDVLFIAATTLNSFDFSVENKLLATTHIGDSLWLENFGDNEILHLTNFADSAVVFFNNQLVLVDEEGNRLDSLNYSQAPIDVVTFSDNLLLILWQDGVYALNEALNLELVISFASVASTRILVQGDMIYLIEESEIVPFNSAYEPQGPISFNPLPYFTPAHYSINSNSLAIAGSKKFIDVGEGNQNSYHSGVLSTVGLQGEQLEHNPDLGIGTFWIETANIVQTSDNPILYNISVNVSGYIVNAGSTTVNSANVTFIGNQGICGFDSETIQLENFALEPNDSVLFEMNGLNYTQLYFPSGVGTINFCVFVSVPNNLSDRNETNDIACANQNISVIVSENEFIESIRVYPNPVSDFLFISMDASKLDEDITVELFDLQGRLQTRIVAQSETQRHAINMRHLASGMYLLQYSTATKMLYMGKVVKE